MKNIFTVVLLVSSIPFAFAQHRGGGGGRGPGPGTVVHRDVSRHPGPVRPGPGPVFRPGPVRPGPVIVRPGPGPVFRPGPVVRHRRVIPTYRRPYYPGRVVVRRDFRGPRIWINARGYSGYGYEESLGTVRVSHYGQPQIQQVDSCDAFNGFGNGLITALRLQAHGDDVNVDRVVVYFENGTSQELWQAAGPLYHLYAGGQASNWMDLNGSGRCIDAVMVEATDDWGGRDATIEILGRVLPR